MCMHAHMGVPAENRRVSNPLEMEWQEFVSCPTWVLGTALWSSGRGRSAFHHLSRPSASGFCTGSLAWLWNPVSNWCSSPKISPISCHALPQDSTFCFWTWFWHLFQPRPCATDSRAHWESSPAMRLLVSVIKKHQVPFCLEWSSCLGPLLGGTLSSFCTYLCNVSSPKPQRRGAANPTNHPAAS